ncbi:e3 ubiquitin ligase ccnb1ip1 [Fusarium beomiforme]|uniref:E3 ubiquitin ligase ccnb1ip1 n=1 Tax=Fusarium beomiforme TaxID=44412 RepID=A0A9P5DWU7_9HYPO|nr:e3 ubiquitin ligase ccnb1ip1 [Fusarium beomiforme]
MSPSNTKVAAGGSFHTFQGIIPKKQPAASSNARPRVAGTRRITTPHACTECKRRKIRCDGKLPCGQCITSRAPKSCSYDKHRQRMIPSRKALDSLAQSLEECRSILRRLYPNHDISALRTMDKQELINLLAQSQCSLGDPLPSPPLESSFPKPDTSLVPSDSLLELQSSLEADLDSLIGELEFEIPTEQLEANDGSNYLTQPTWWDYSSRQWSSVPVPSMMEGQPYGHDLVTPMQHSIFTTGRNLIARTRYCQGSDMERALTCNNLKCRKELSERALVTTCSHIFCMECAQRLGVTEQEADRRNTCPACHSQLTNPDDAVITNLNPSEDYKTSVLSGLSPNVIMECAGRALSFWAYQTTQDIYYQQYLYKTLSDKYSALSIRLEKTVNDANSEIEGLHHKLSNLAAEQDDLRRKNDEISRAYKDKSRKVLQLQELYDKVKRKAELGQIQKAASDAVDSSLHTIQLDPGYGVNFPKQSHVESNPAPVFNQSHRIDISGMNTSHPRNYTNLTREGNHWPRLGGASQRDASEAPVGGLRRSGIDSTSVHQGTSLPTLAGTPVPSFGGPRQSASTFAPGFTHHRGSLAGVGLTSGIKPNSLHPLIEVLIHRGIIDFASSITDSTSNITNLAPNVTDFCYSSVALDLSSPQDPEDDMPQITSRSNGRSRQIFARIKEKTKEWHKLKRSERGSEHLRTRYLADQTNNRANKQANNQVNNQHQNLPSIVITAPDMEPEQPPPSQGELPAELPADSSTCARWSHSFRKLLLRSWSSNEKEVILSHPLVTPHDNLQSGQGGDTVTASEPKFVFGQDVRGKGAWRVWRKKPIEHEPDVKIIVDESHISFPQRYCDNVALENAFLQLQGHAQTLKRKCEQLEEARLELEEQIHAGKQFTLALFNLAHQWEAWSPVLEEGPVPMVRVLTGLQTIMLWLHGRIEWYERKNPGIREEYNNHMGLL